jgi:hypothetical protein
MNWNVNRAGGLVSDQWTILDRVLTAPAYRVARVVAERAAPSHTGGNNVPR